MKVAEATFLVVDTETTGLDPKKDEVVEIGAVATSVENGALGMWATLVRPRIPIPPEVSAVHGLTDEDVANAPDFGEAVTGLLGFAARFPNPVFVAHNAEFDSAFLGFDDSQLFRMLCTKRLAMHIWPAAPNHRNQTLRYWLGFGRSETFGIAPHRALGDALVTGRILISELDEVTIFGITEVDDLFAFANNPVILERWPFGRYYGELIAGTDPSYIAWCLREIKDLSRDLRFTLELRMKGAA